MNEMMDTANPEAGDAASPPAGGDNGGGGNNGGNGKPRRFGRRRPGRRFNGPRPPRDGEATSADGAPRAEGEGGEAIAFSGEGGGDNAGNSQNGNRTREPRRENGEGGGNRRGRNRRGGPNKKQGAPGAQGGDGNKQRLHKALAQTGLGSRREMETLIAEGQVEINGEKATVGQSVEPGDRVHVKRRKVNVSFGDDNPRVMLYHKPAGEIVSRDDPEGRPTVFDNMKAPDHGKWIAVGRLDFNSEGLLLFTTYGELANRLMHPRYEVVREYSVRVLGELTHEQEDQLIDGIELEDGPARVLSLDIEGGEGANRWYRLTLQEGRNREVRRMFEALGLTVSRLIRIRYGDITMPSWLKRGQTKLLDETETFALLTSVGLRSNSARAQLKRALKGKPVPTPQIGVMRNAREHELAREGRLGDDPANAQRARKRGKGKPRIDALATSFGFDNAPGGGRRRPGGNQNAMPGNGGQNAGGRNKRRGQGRSGAGVNGNVANSGNAGSPGNGQARPRGRSNNKNPRQQKGRTPGIDYAGLPRDED